MRDLRQTPQYAIYMQNIGWQIDWEEGVNYYFKKLPVVGCVAKIQRPEEIKYQDLLNVCKKHRVFEMVIEPKDDSQVAVIRNCGFKLSKSPYLPSKTIQIDVTKSNDELLRAMHHKTRYNIKVAQKNGVEIRTSDNITEFASFWQKCAKTQRGMFLSQKKELIEIFKAFGEQAELLFAYSFPQHREIVAHYDDNPLPISHDEHTLLQKELIAGLLLIHTKNISYYMHAASNEEGKKLFAPTLLVWEGIKHAKANGSHLFDFEGIYDDRFPLPTWKGFSRFKRSFGGKEVLYPGCYFKFRFPI